MTPEWRNAIDSFVSIFSTMDFRNGALYCVIAICVAGYCCMEGYRIYKMILAGLGFVFGYRLGYQLFTRIGFQGEVLLMAEVFCGLLLMVLAYRIYLAGVFIAAFQFVWINVPVYLQSFVGEKLALGKMLGFVLVPALSLVAALIVAKLSMKLQRPVIVCLTAVIGGFAAVNFFLRLIPIFPYELSLPDETSVIWLAAKVFLSAAGVGIQGIKDPPGVI